MVAAVAVLNPARRGPVCVCVCAYMRHARGLSQPTERHRDTLYAKVHARVPRIVLIAWCVPQEKVKFATTITFVCVCACVLDCEWSSSNIPIVGIAVACESQ